MSTKELSRAELVTQAFECCQQLIRSYSPDTLDQATRLHLVDAMEHYKQIALRDIGKET